MEFDEIVVKESPGLCRCCLSEGCYKDLGSEYTWMSENEVYADMLLECFDISITQHNEGPNGSSRLICEVCITRLRDACNFKKQVLESEKKFVDMVAKGEFRPKVLVYQAQMKAEEEPAESQEEIVEYLDDNIDYEDDEPLKRDATLPAQETDNNITVELLPIKGKRGRPRKSTDVKAVKAAKKVKVDDEKPKTSKAVAKDTQKLKVKLEKIIKQEQEEIHEMQDVKREIQIEFEQILEPKIEKRKVKEEQLDPKEQKQNVEEQHLEPKVKQQKLKGQKQESQEKSASPNKQDIIFLLVTILENTRITPFTHNNSSYVCFYCCGTFLESSKLQQHMTEEHRNIKMTIPLLKKIAQRQFKLDISEIACKLCSKIPENYEAVLDHLIEEHGFKLNKDCANSMMRFKLNDNIMSCVYCGENFKFFQTMQQHVNKNHSNLKKKYLCSICGIGFVKASAYSSHKSLVHSCFKCKDCEETFIGKRNLRIHKVQKHGLLFKCPKCPENFVTEKARRRHLAFDHDHKKYPCDQCPQVFVHHSELTRHQSVVHLRLRQTECKICGSILSNSYQLKNHMAKHDDARPFECDICKKAFKSKDIRNKHRRIHTDDTRYSCEVCGKTYSHPDSRKNHMKVHKNIENY